MAGSTTYPTPRGLLRINVPEAMEDGKPVEGRIVVTFQPNAVVQSQYLSDRGHRAYPADRLEDWESVMTVQDDEDAREHVVPRKQWWFGRYEDGRLIPDPCYVHVEGGFQPGKVYQVIYSPTGAPVAGLGLLATRDIASHLRFDRGPQAGTCLRIRRFPERTLPALLPVPRREL